MARYRVRTVPQDGRPEEVAVDADSIADALEHVRDLGHVVLSVEVADGAPLSYEPAGEPPPPAPRQLPDGATDLLGASTSVLGGAIFTIVAVTFMVVGLVILTTTGDLLGLLFAVFPVIHLVVGLGLLRSGWRERQRRRAAYVNGVAATATIDRVGFNESVRVNRRHPREIGWTFFIHDVAYHGSRSTLKDTLEGIREGDRIWVLYDPNDPTNSVEWPPR